MKTNLSLRPTAITSALCLALSLAACASTPAPNARLEAARSSLQTATTDASRAESAVLEIERSKTALARADRAWRERADQAEVDHLATLAQRNIDLAVAAGRRKEIERAIEQTARERDEIRVAASRRDAASAQTEASAAQRQAAELANRNAALEGSAAQAQARADALARRLEALQAKQTERGLVVTFSDVLFDVGQAVLRPGALARVEQLAAVLKEYPERNVLVEGFTDSTGSAATNQALSERRAMAVRTELVGRGIAANRIVARGHADRYPVAANDSASGRQQNRRVEAVLSDAAGQLPMRP